jgi:SAM-dependent methyltransferase
MMSRDPDLDGTPMNPWLNIPLADYEAHMAMPGIGQSQLLSDILAEALNTYRPGSVAVLGCAGGNGFDRILPRPETRVVGIDLNPDYVQQAKLRYRPLLPRLDLMVGDIENMRFSFPPVDLVFAGLVFEYIDVGRSLRNIYPILTRDGVLVVALQLPSQGMEPVTPSSYLSLGLLKGHMSLIPPKKFVSVAQGVGFRTNEKRIWKASGGKEFTALDLSLDNARKESGVDAAPPARRQ